MNKKHTIDMVNGPLMKNIIMFSIPVILQNFLQMVFNAADTIVVGKFAGDAALAAVGSTGSLCFMTVSLFFGLATGANVIVAQYIGAKEKENISKASHTAIMLSLISGAFLTVLGLCIARPMLELMNTPDSIIDLSTLYLRIYFGGIIFILVYNFGAAILRSKGDTKRPLYYLLIGGSINVVLNLIFVICLHWSVAGVATATVISNAIIAVLILIALMKDDDETKIIPSKLKLDGFMLKRIMQIGIPAGIQGMMFALSNILVQSSINSFNDSVIVAGNSAAANVESFVYIGMNFCVATLSFTSQNVGAKNHKRISKILADTMILDMIGALVLSLVVFFFGRQILGLYTNESAVVDAGMVRITWVALPLILNAVLDIFVNSLRGMGYSTVPTVMMILGICGIRVVWLTTVFKALGTLTSIYMCFPVSWAVTSLVLWGMWIYCYRKYLKNNS